MRMGGKSDAMRVDINFSKWKDLYPFFEGMEKAYEKGIYNGLGELKELVHKKMLENMAIYGLADSKLAQQIFIRRSKKGLTINVGTDYVLYVEYGTGIKGSNNPHPSPQIAWQYDVNEHGDAGWVYKADNGSFYWTKGQEAKPFMYLTWRYAMNIADKVIEKHIDKEVDRVIRRGKW